jgi:NAD(P)H-hydrate epimerase
MLLNEGMEVCGRIETCYLGASDILLDEIADVAIIEEYDEQFALPPREVLASKFDFGRVAIVAGSKYYPGAAALTANACITAGAGLVYLHTCALHPSLMPEIIPNIVPATELGGIASEALDPVLKYIQSSDTLVIGPGLGSEPETMQFVRDLYEKAPEGMLFIIDADGLKAFGKDTIFRDNTIITPHTGEFALLIGAEREAVEAGHAEMAKKWAAKMNAVILLKYLPTVITDGDLSYWNAYGNPGMATAGSGDVLTGIIAAMYAQGMEALEAAAFGAYLHSAAGDYYADKYSEETLTASEMIKTLKKVIKS